MSIDSDLEKYSLLRDEEYEGRLRERFERLITHRLGSGFTKSEWFEAACQLLDLAFDEGFDCGTTVAVGGVEAGIAQTDTERSGESTPEIAVGAEAKEQRDFNPEVTGSSPVPSLDSTNNTGACGASITDRNDEHTPNVCLLVSGHPESHYDPLTECSWTDADHYPGSPGKPVQQPDLSPPWVLYLEDGLHKEILPANRPGSVANVGHLPRHQVDLLIRRANEFYDALREVRMTNIETGIASTMRKIEDIRKSMS